MPQRATSRGLLAGGTLLVILSGTLAIGPVFWVRPDLAHQLVAHNNELAHIAERINRIRDVSDILRDTHAAERGYLLTGTQHDRAVYQDLARAASQSVADLNATSMHPQAWVPFDALTNRLLGDLARGTALQDAGRHDEAVAASDIDTSRALIAGIDEITRARVGALRDRYLAVADEIRAASDKADELVRVLVGPAGALFALGCMALATYLRRHFAVEAELRSGRDAAREASALKTSFIAAASHDLRQPLHAISMFVGVLRRRSREPAILTVVDNIATAVALMQRMFAALLDVARLDAGAVKIERSAVALQDLFSPLAVEFAASAAAKGLSLQIQPTPLSVATDPALLETILRNLLANAVKFTDSGGVGIATQRRGTTVDIIVFDTGIGIAAKDQSIIFDQFERVSQPGGSRDGLGLGLSIVRRMADLLGVTIALASEIGKGSRFTLSLPYADPPQPTVPDTNAPEHHIRGHRILVLDDHAEARKAIAMAIETLDAAPLEAASPEAAFSLLAAMAPETPDAAVVDHDLGGGQTGPDFLDAHSARSGRALPAVIITGSTEAATLAKLAAGGRPWLIKPIDLDVLRLTLSRLANPVPAP
jgi:signal transduction histidine kinase/ActR/RegA family two-component response regulator